MNGSCRMGRSLSSKYLDWNIYCIGTFVAFVYDYFVEVGDGEASDKNHKNRSDGDVFLHRVTRVGGDDDEDDDDEDDNKSYWQQ